MKPLEITFFSFLVLTYLACLLLGKRNYSKALALALVAAGAMAFQVMLEGRRWQIVPGYLVAFMLLFFCLYRVNQRQFYLVKPIKSRVKTFFSWVGFSILSLLLAFALWLPLNLPDVQLPKPQGAFAVGRWKTENFDFWYPAREPQGAKFPFLEQAPWFMPQLQGLSGTATDKAVQNPQPGKPLLVILGDQNLSYIWMTSLAEEWASRGYPVVGLNLSGVQEEAFFSWKALQRWNAEEGPTVAGQKALLKTNPKIAYLQYFLAEERGGDFLVQQHAALLESILQLQQAGRLPLSINWIGVGFGWGGTAMLELCVKDPSCQGSLDVNGWVTLVPEQLVKPHQILMLPSRKEQQLSLGEYALETMQGQLWDWTDIKYIWPDFTLEGRLTKTPPEPLRQELLARLEGLEQVPTAEVLPALASKSPAP